MNQEKRAGFRGPLALAFGGFFVTFPLLFFAQQLFDGRLSFPYREAAAAIIMFTSVFVFFGVLVAGVGLQMILEDSK
jgi:hypothetical protein